LQHAIESNRLFVINVAIPIKVIRVVIHGVDPSAAC
jgi:hypothetical protein